MPNVDRLRDGGAGEQPVGVGTVHPTGALRVVVDAEVDGAVPAVDGLPDEGVLWLGDVVDGAEQVPAGLDSSSGINRGCPWQAELGWRGAGEPAPVADCGR